MLTKILEGMSNADISDRMNISISAVKKHVYHIFAKMEINTRTQLRVALDKVGLL
ncbi:MAG: helix-turn-helix transcriptional regulator [Anaerocolumna sp.]